MSDTALVCPRCAGQMNSYERAGVQIDQCEKCHGIFLDRGELERLAEVESSYYQQPAPAPQQQPPAYQQQPPAYQQQPPGYPPQAYPPGYYDQGEHHGGHHGSRRRGMFHDLFGD